MSSATDSSNNLISFLLSPNFNSWLGVLRVSFIGIFLILFISLIILALKNSYFKFLFLWDLGEVLTFRPHGVKKVVKNWNAIKARMDTGLESEYKLAVIEADNMMEDVLKRMGYPGESLGDRLEKITTVVLSNLSEVRECHIIRNNIIHDPSYKLSADEAKRILAVYEKAFQSLEVF